MNALVQIGYQYASTYGASTGGSSLGDPASTIGTLGAAGADRGVGRMTWAKRRISLGAPSTGSDGLGGWTLSPHHFYDMTGRGGLYFGDGTVRLGERNYPVIRAYRNNISATDIAVAPDGTVYVAAWDGVNGGIFRIGRDGGYQLVAGGGSVFTDGAPATQVKLRNPNQVAVGSDGSLYFVVTDGGRVCKVTPDGIIHSIAGTGQNGTPTGDGGPATQAVFNSPAAIALGPDGSVFVGDNYASSNAAVRRIAPNGIITHYAGNDGTGTTNDTPGKATTIRLTGIYGLCVDGAGNLYIAEAGQYRVRKVAPDGTMTTVVNGGIDHFLTPNDVAMGPDGALYIADGCDPGGNGRVQRIHRLDPDGTLSVVAGGGVPVLEPDGIPALGCHFTCPVGIDLDPSGNIYVADQFAGGGQALRIAPDLPGSNGGEFAIPSQDASEVYYFNLRGQHLRTRDALTGGVRYRFTYDAAGRLATIVDANNDVTTIVRDGNGKPTGIVAPYGQQTTLTTVTPNADVYLATVKNPALATYTLDPDNGGLLRTLKDPKNNTHTFTFASDGRLNVDADPAGGSQTLPAPVYNGLARTVTRTTGESRPTSYTTTDLFDGTRQRRIVGPDQLLRYMSDSTDARQRKWSPEGTAGTDSLVKEPRFGMLAPLVARSSERVPSGKVRTVEVSRPQGTGGYSSGFNPPFSSGQWKELTSINKRTAFQTIFDASLPRQLTTISPLGRQAITTVDSIGRPLTVTISGLDPIAFAYDFGARGRLIHLKQADRAWRYGYDGSGRLESVTDTLGRVTRFGYDDAGRVTTQTMADSQVVSYGYDHNGNLVSVTPPGRPAHGFDYTSVDLTQHYTPPDVGIGSTATSYTYNLDRQLTHVEHQGNLAVTLGYETTEGRLESVAIPRGNSVLTYYPLTGQLSTVSSPDSVILSYTYDGPLPLSETWSGRVAGNVDVTYDRDFRPLELRVNGSNVVTLRYDLDGLLASAGIDSLYYNTTGLLDSTMLAGFTATSSQDYNVFGELANLHYSWGAGGSYLESLTRDGAGRIIMRTEAISADTTRTTSYVYTTAGRLKDVLRGANLLEHYEYDANCNRMFSTGASLTDSASATYDDQDRLLRYKDTRYSYTANGELTLRVEGPDTTRYTYDPLGNLVTVVLPNQDRIDYLIDGWNRRVGRMFNGVLQRAWLYQDGLNPVAELDGQGSVVAQYVYGSSDHVPDYMVKGGATYRLVADHLGSVRLVVDATTGAVAERIDYDAWGRVINDTNAGFQAFAFAGGLYDQDTKLVRFGARDYDASIGRWLTKDPIVFGGGATSLYEYVHSSPMNFTDPAGLDVYIGLYEGAGPFGHIGLGTTAKKTFGLYPDIPEYIKPVLLAGVEVPGRVLRDDPTKVEHMLRIRTSPQQDVLVTNAIKRAITERRMRYRLLGKHFECSDFVLGVLREAGIDVEGDTFPRGEFEKIINRRRGRLHTARDAE